MKMEYIIPFNEIESGRKKYEFEIKKPFFERYEDESNIKDGEIKTEITIERKPSFIKLEFDIKGKSKVECDRCLDLLDVKIDYKTQLFVKFGNFESEDPDVIVVDPDETELDLQQIIFELITLCIPIRNVHPNDENGNSTCNQTMIEMLEQHISTISEEEYEDVDFETDDSDTEAPEAENQTDEDSEIDPRWDKLKKLLNNK